MSALVNPAEGPPVAAEGIEGAPGPPPDHAYITLSEALSWIAFHRSMDCDALFVRLSDDTDAAPDAHHQIAVALKGLIEHGRSGRIRFLGKYIANTRDDLIKDTDTNPIDPIRLIDWAQFDVVRDGLRRGSGLTWRLISGSISPARIVDSRRDYYHSVQVARADLMAAFQTPTELEMSGNVSAAVSTGGPQNEMRVTGASDENAPMAAIQRTSITPYSDQERQAWMVAQPVMAADTAFELYRKDARHCRMKRPEFRTEWKQVKGTKQGRQPKSQIAK